MNYEILGKAIAKNFTLKGKLGANSMNLYDLFSLNLSTLDDYHQSLQIEFNKFNTSSYLKRRQQTNTTAIKFSLEVLEAIMDIKTAKEENAQKRKLTREANQERLANLKAIKAQKEFAKLGKKSLSALEKEIEELEGSLI